MTGSVHAGGIGSTPIRRNSQAMAKPTTGPNDPAPTKDGGDTGGGAPYCDPREEMTRDEECVLAKREDKNDPLSACSTTIGW